MLLHEHPDFINFVRILASDRGIREAIVEKDYWVTHVLHELRKSDIVLAKSGDVGENRRRTIKEVA